MSIEEMIKEYSLKLMKMKEESSLPQPQETGTSQIVIETETDEDESFQPAEEDFMQETDSAEDFSDGDTLLPDTNRNDKTPSFSLEESENYAIFSANVFAGNNTYPIENAKVSVYRDDEIFAFLSTDENGLTKKVKLPSYPESNSLESGNENQRLDYYADVFAEGFTNQKGLLVSAVGGSDIVLDVSMTPLSDEVN